MTFDIVKRGYCFTYAFIQYGSWASICSVNYQTQILNSATFSIGKLLHLNSTAIFIYIALVFPTFIFRPFKLQNIAKAFIICYRPSALWDINTASSANARKNIYKVAISRIKRFTGNSLCISKYSNKYGYI
jgi:hypothetical protein